MTEIRIDMTSKFAYFWFVGPKDDFMVSCQFPFFLQHLNSSHVWRWCERTHTHTRTHWIIYSGVRTYTFLVWTSECFPVTVTLFEIPLIHFSFQTRSNFSCTSLKMLQPLLSLCWSQWKLSFTAGAAHEIFFFFLLFERGELFFVWLCSWGEVVMMTSRRSSARLKLRRCLSQQLRSSTSKAWDFLWRNVRERRLAGQLTRCKSTAARPQEGTVKVTVGHHTYRKLCYVAEVTVFCAAWYMKKCSRLDWKLTINHDFDILFPFLD